MNVTEWTQHFERNKHHRIEPNWQAPHRLHGGTLRKLIRSLQQFQLGDGGGPAYLIAGNRGTLLDADAGMKRLVDLWFAEEAEHSRLLGSALQRFGAPEIQSHWSFSLFCGLREHLGVQFELSALLLTEIVSHVYYKMMYRHCPDEAVRGMCRLIIRDEAGHIAFHRARLRAEGRQHGRSYGRVWESLFRARGLAAGTVLWVNHRSALLAMGATDGEFYGGIWRDMGRFIRRLREAPSSRHGARPTATAEKEIHASLSMLSNGS
ncbi:hypothetical protein [Roseimicrobium sp. ORNL1]|uniref:hypothetical protein n=1 Tax=Roseimicrobium sp. ORNL1 TaxID=2711231 RepID=UPI0013E2029D|nr:hypothetical protein [Roseimicrobium sp. ORNL1]QIF02200.1 hypothetical protein G5S37_11890 [Roseimicrobium sp. ORNL1]